MKHVENGIFLHQIPFYAWALDCSPLFLLNFFARVLRVSMEPNATSNVNNLVKKKKYRYATIHWFHCSFVLYIRINSIESIMKDFDSWHNSREIDINASPYARASLEFSDYIWSINWTHSTETTGCGWNKKMHAIHVYRDLQTPLLHIVCDLQSAWHILFTFNSYTFHTNIFHIVKNWRKLTSQISLDLNLDRTNHWRRQWMQMGKWHNSADLRIKRYHWIFLTLRITFIMMALNFKRIIHLANSFDCHWPYSFIKSAVLFTYIGSNTCDDFINGWQ